MKHARLIFVTALAVAVGAGVPGLKKLSYKNALKLVPGRPAGKFPS